MTEEQLEALHASTGASGSGAAEGGQDTPPALRAMLEQLSGRLFKHKIEQLLRELRTTVARCALCGAMFSLAEKPKLSCPARDAEFCWGPHGER